MCYVIDYKVIIFGKFSCILDKCFTLINSVVDGLCKMEIQFIMEIHFIMITRSTNRSTVH